MTRIPLGRKFLDPRRANNFLDTCAFDPKYSPEHEAAEQIRSLGKQQIVQLLLAHSNQKEIDHPNTPADVKSEALAMIFTIPTMLTTDEVNRQTKIHEVLTGNGKPEKYAADADHVFEAGKYGGGYFITTDQRILDKRVDLNKVSQANILKPSEWLKIFDTSAKNGGAR